MKNNNIREITVTDIMKDYTLDPTICRNYIIETPTGSGKTYYCTHSLLEEVRRSGGHILYLANRTAVINQMQEKVLAYAYTHPTEYVTIMESINFCTYQKLENDILYNRVDNYLKSHYRFVICDESHYFLHDSNFNAKTILSFTLLTQNSNSITFFLSATMEKIKTPLIETLRMSWVYKPEKPNLPVFLENSLYQIVDTIPKDYSYVAPKCFQEIEEIPQIVSKLSGKTAIFVSSIAEGQKIQTLLAKNDKHNVAFLSSQYRSDAEMNATMQQITEEEASSAKILIATAVIDNGINLSDPELKNIFVLTHTKEDLIQELGRKRLQEGEQISLFLCKRSMGYFRILRKQYQNTLNQYQMCMYNSQNTVLYNAFESETMYNVIRKFAYHNPIYNNLVINPLSIINLATQLNFCNQIIDRYVQDGNLAFAYMQLDWLDSSLIHKLEDVSHDASMGLFEKFLETHAGIKMPASELQTLINANEIKSCLSKLSLSKKFTESVTVTKTDFERILDSSDLSYQLCKDKIDNKQMWWIEKSI